MRLSYTKVRLKKSCANERVLKIKEAAKFLRITTITTYKLVKEGKIPGRKVGGQYRILWSDLMAFLEDSDL
jgi:excisionase family DNA binding protein